MFNLKEHGTERTHKISDKVTMRRRHFRYAAVTLSFGYLLGSLSGLLQVEYAIKRGSEMWYLCPINAAYCIPPNFP